MKKKYAVILLLLCCTGAFSFFEKPAAVIASQEKIMTYYASHFRLLDERLAALRLSVETGSNTKSIRENFLLARIAYKKLEPILEYYFEGDVKYFNGLAVNFIEEEDPSAYQEPQGFQVIETFLFPEYYKEKKDSLLLYIKKLEAVTTGIGNNTSLFRPAAYMPDAIMEELYRILSLGITGFDSPIALQSIPEARSALNGVLLITQVYKKEWLPLDQTHYNAAIQLLNASIAYLEKNQDFNNFNRMVFITRFLNPLCEAFASIKQKTGNKENQIRYSLVKKQGSLFKRSSLDTNRYLYDDQRTAARATLGKKLFYEPLLSVIENRSCATCHQAALAFTDGLPKALQLDGHSTLPRNTPTLWNASLQITLFYDSRHMLPEDVIREVLGNEKEMNKGIDKAIGKLQSNNTYQRLFRLAYPDQGSAVTETNTANAIATYLRTLISYNSGFDKYVRGDKTGMSKTAVNGFNIFMGKAKCATCHYAPLFNGSKPPTYYYQESEVLGVPSSTDTLHPQLDNDPGRIVSLNKDFLNHAFKTPTLRNIALTAPYMHNGVYKTLEEVINFYNTGGGQGLGLNVPNQTLPADKLLLTEVEKKQLKAFLLTLTDTSAVH